MGENAFRSSTGSYNQLYTNQTMSHISPAAHCKEGLKVEELCHRYPTRTKCPNASTIAFGIIFGGGWIEKRPENITPMCTISMLPAVTGVFSTPLA
mmetsp:Transcript_30606/g.59701  ORF Transcript_30606/g.59701 Transcript_30606/m.59701 type:complete len:96 (+) Transcript_30606:95-382(+)